jgi:hypothetical protein
MTTITDDQPSHKMPETQMDPMSADARMAFLNRACAFILPSRCARDHSSRMSINLSEWPEIEEIDLIDFAAEGSTIPYPVARYFSARNRLTRKHPLSPDDALGLTLISPSPGETADVPVQPPASATRVPNNFSP